MKRSSDFPDCETELDKAIDEIAQATIEAARDWRKPYYTRRGIFWAELRRAVPLPPLSRSAA